MEAIEMPKTYKQLLDELEVGGSILISKEKRDSWSTNITRMHAATNKQFIIKTSREEPKETRVWRLSDIVK